MVLQGVDAHALSIANADARGADNAARAMAYRRLFNEKLAPELGGKGAWDTILEELAPKIGYRTAPGSLRLAIKDVWYDFLASNAAAVERGNTLIEQDLAATGQVSLETRNALSVTYRSFTFPPELVARIEARAVFLAGHIIARSSGRREDSYERNLAGILTSEIRDDELAVVQAVREVFRDAVRRFWIYQNEEDEGTIEGLPRVLTPDEGLGLVIQSFLQLDAAGTAMSDLYRHFSIEAVVGDADTAVRPIHANVCGFLMPRDGSAKDTLEHNPSYLDIPHSFRLKGVEYSADTNPERIREILAQYPRVHGIISPVSEAQAREVVRVSLALEEEIGVPLDIEWGFLDGELYIVQMRPIIGDFSKPLVEPSAALAASEPVVRTPIALGQTPAGGITSRAVYVARGTSAAAVAAFERDNDSPYIRIQYDAISAILGRTTRAMVLVDPWQGSRQAHNVNVVSGRLAAGEFVYANRPVLRKGLAESLDFEPVPGHPGIFVSKQEVTYFADGLRGAFYVESQGARVGGQRQESVFEEMDRETPKTESVASSQLPVGSAKSADEGQGKDGEMSKLRVLLVEEDANERAVFEDTWKDEISTRANTIL